MTFWTRSRIEQILDKVQDLLDPAASQLPAGLSESEVSDGLREALKVGTRRVVRRLGKVDGFAADPEVRIPLPDSLGIVRSTLDRVGMDSLVDDLELGLNRAAEAATPKAKKLFRRAIKNMTLDDVMAIYRGPDDAATRYFQNAMSAPLAREMRPVVESSLADVGAAQLYARVMDTYHAIPFVPAVETDLAGYVVERAMDGIFLQLAREEAAIRKEPAKRTTDLLKRVFGAD